MKLKLNVLVLFSVSMYVLSSCGSGGSSDDSANDKAAEFDKAKSLGEEIKDITYKIPPPCEIPYLLMQTGAEYNQSLLNSREKLDVYSAQPDKAALNLGVYAADIGYLSSYEKTQESIEYLESCKRLAEDLGVTNSFDPEMLKQFEIQIGNKDSLCILLNKAIEDTDKYLKGGQSKLGALMVTGSFVESLHLATGIIASYPKNAFKDNKQKISVLTPLMQIVVNQRASVAEVSKMLKSVDQSGPVTQILSDLDKLEAAYVKLDWENQLKSGNATFTDDTLSGVTKVIDKLRADIVN